MKVDKKLLERLTNKALNDVLKDELNRIAKREARKIAKGIISENYPLIVKMLKTKSSIALRKTVNSMGKGMTAELYFR